MRNPLALSLFANFVLILALLWLSRLPNSCSNLETDSVGTAARAAAAVVATPGHSSSPLTAAAFRWSQLESTDYRTYVANLRDIGCPEQTVRDIITADVDSLYRARRQELVTNTVAFNSPGLANNERLQLGFDELRRQEAAVLRELLGPEPSAQPSNSPAAPARFVRRLDQVVLPLALQQVDLAKLNFRPRELAAIQDLQQKFRNQLTDSGLAPSDPAYRALWQHAQAESDDLLQAMLGGEDFVDYELAARETAQPPPSRFP